MKTEKSRAQKLYVEPDKVNMIKGARLGHVMRIQYRRVPNAMMDVLLGERRRRRRPDGRIIRMNGEKLRLKPEPFKGLSTVDDDKVVPLVDGIGRNIFIRHFSRLSPYINFDTERFAHPFIWVVPYLHIMLFPYWSLNLPTNY